MCGLRATSAAGRRTGARVRFCIIGRPEETFWNGGTDGVTSSALSPVGQPGAHRLSKTCRNVTAELCRHVCRQCGANRGGANRANSLRSPYRNSALTSSPKPPMRRRRLRHTCLCDPAARSRSTPTDHSDGTRAYFRAEDGWRALPHRAGTGHRRHHGPSPQPADRLDHQPPRNAKSRASAATSIAETTRLAELRLFQVRGADIEFLGRDLEARGRARATITRQLCTVAGFYRYAVEEELLDHSPAAYVRRPRLDHESHATGLDRNELGALLVAAGLARISRFLANS